MLSSLTYLSTTISLISCAPKVSWYVHYNWHLNFSQELSNVSLAVLNPDLICLTAYVRSVLLLFIQMTKLVSEIHLDKACICLLKSLLRFAVGYARAGSKAGIWQAGLARLENVLHLGVWVLNEHTYTYAHKVGTVSDIPCRINFS